jgi:hypothetical protein
MRYARILSFLATPPGAHDQNFTRRSSNKGKHGETDSLPLTTQSVGNEPNDLSVSDVTLFEAIKTNDIIKVGSLLDGANVNSQGERVENGRRDPQVYHFTPLVLTIQSQDIDMAPYYWSTWYAANVSDREEEAKYGWESEPYPHYLSPL